MLTWITKAPSLNVTTKTSYVIINPMLIWFTKAPIVTTRAHEMCPKLTMRHYTL